MYPQRKYSQPPAHQTSQVQSCPQNEVSETAAASSHENRHTLTFQIQKRLPDQAAFWRKSTVEIGPSFRKTLSAGNNSGNPAEITPLVLRGDHKAGLCQSKNPQVMGQTVIETGEKDQREGTLVQCEPAKFILVDTNPNNLARTTEERVDMMEIGQEVHTKSRAKADIIIETEDIMETEQQHCPIVQTRENQSEYKAVSDLPGDREDRDESAVDSEHESPSTEDLRRERCPTPTLSQVDRPRGPGIKVSCHFDNVQTTNGYIRGSSSCVAASALASGQKSSFVEDLNSTAIKPREKLENSNLSASQTNSHLAPLVPSFPLKRKHEVLQDQNMNCPQKIHLIKRRLKWQPPCSSQEKPGDRKVSKRRAAKPKTSMPEHPTILPEPYVPKKTRQKRSNIDHRGHEFARSTPKQRSSFVTYQPPKHKRANCGPDQATNLSQTSHERTNTGEPQPRSTDSCLTTALICDPRIKDSGKLNQVEKMQLLEETRQAEALVLTMVYKDGATQLDPEQKFTPLVCGLLVLMKNDLDRSTPEDSLGPNDSLVYFKLEQMPVLAQQHKHESQTLFTRDVLLQVLSRSQLVVCYKAKDLLRTALQFYKQDLNWKEVAGCHIHDPQVSGWLLDPADPSSCYQGLLMKHCKRPHKTPVLGTKKDSQLISDLSLLYWLNNELCTKLQAQGLWELYSHIELKMIPVLAAMEGHCIHVDKEALKRTSDLLGAKMKQLEQEAHQAAGQMFLITSNSQLRMVLFEKLRLHEHCKNKKLPKTINKQHQSTSEATLLQLQDLHPLPKVVLEYRQVHKIKSTFVDGILSCMGSKSYISSTWYQTCVVTGRISAKHPNFQALPRQPLQITKKLYIQGKEEEVVTVHPRVMFIPQEGWTFLAADFCQVELRLLAHLSSDPELLRIFTNPQVDVFTMLASQWKGVSEGEVTSEDREQAKRVVYSVVYGAGHKRLSGILGVSAEQARQFQDSFLQTYREVQAFIQRTNLQCHKQGYVLSIMGRRRSLPNIQSLDWGIRMQAERQAVNFVVQGSAADLCKMAMINIFNLVSSSSSLSARLIAQLHDELLYEVEDSQVEHFAVLVKSTMESLQHIHHFGVHLKVPLKVAVYSGKSWGSMSELNVPSTSPTPCL
ncbi:DNA polymerase nu [Anabas testudineus]|nr:DNA polymerase nu [Anabas testudineus]